MGGSLEGWWVASKGLGALPRTRGSTLAHGCGREGSGALPLPRAAAVSTGLRVLAAEEGAVRGRGEVHEEELVARTERRRGWRYPQAD